MGKIYVKDSGAWKQVMRIWVKTGGVWTNLVKGMVTDGGIGKQFYPDTIQTVTYNAGQSGTYTVPAGVTQLTISMVAGGGSGRGGDDYGSGGGGSGGYYQNHSYTVTPGQTISYSVGNAAQQSTFGTLTCTAGGTPASSSYTDYGAGGTPNGTNGQTGNQSNFNCPAIAGDGANSPWGTGGAGGEGGCPHQSGAGGANATGYGAGGGGGGNNANGGTGSAGFITVVPVGGNAQNYGTAGTFSFTVPAGVTSINYTVYGAGGGSGACDANGDAWVGSGGGAGGKTTGSLAVTPSEVLTLIVGLRGYGASYRFNSNYSYNPNNSTLGTGIAGAASYIKRGATTLVTSNGGGYGAQYASGGAGGSPTVSGTSPADGQGTDGQGCRGPSPSYIGYGYVGAICGGTNGSGTPPTGNSSNRGTGYGNGGGQPSLGVGIDGQDGAVLLTW